MPLDQPRYILYLMIAVIMVGAFVFLFIFLMVKNERRRSRDKQERILLERNFENVILQSQIEVQESTFSSISKELHDNIGQLLSTVRALLGITEMQLGTPPDTLLTANATLAQAIIELRSLSKSLDKEWLEQFDLLVNLKNECSRIDMSRATKVHLTYPEKLPLEPAKQLILFRIIQEAMQNALKHSFAKNVYVDLQYLENVLLITIKDDGKGFDQQKIADGVGLINIKHRVKLLAGSVNWTSDETGTSVFIILKNI